MTDDIRLPFSLGEKRKLRAARGSGITATSATGQWPWPCRLITYRQRFARAAPAPRAKRFDSKNRGRASPVKPWPCAYGNFLTFSSVNVVVSLSSLISKKRREEPETRTYSRRCRDTPVMFVAVEPSRTKHDSDTIDLIELKVQVGFVLVKVGFVEVGFVEVGL